MTGVETNATPRFAGFCLATTPNVAICVANAPRDVDNRGPVLHYIAKAAQSQGQTISACAKRLGLTVAEARAQADPRADITLSQLYAWREILDVPLSELTPDLGVVPDPIRNRGLLILIMKTARLICETTNEGTPGHYAAETLVNQLIMLMPELKDVPPWPSVGKSHAARPEGAVRRVSSDFSRMLEER